MKDLNERIEISYPLGLIEELKNIPNNQVMASSVLVNNDETGGILIACPNQDIEHFKIRSSPPPEPTLKFRMLNYKKQIYVVEIWILFEVKPERILKLHLNPHNSEVKKLLKLCKKTGLISFHFYDTDTHSLSSVVTNLNDEEQAWVTRNCKLSKKLIADRMGYDILADHITVRVWKANRVYEYYAHGKSECFVREGGKQVMLHDI